MSNQTAPTHQVLVEIDPATLARASAYASVKRSTVERLVSEYLHSIGDDFVLADLPHDAGQPFLRMLRHGGRDTTAMFLNDGGWDEFERPMPGYFFAWVRRNPGLVIDGGANTGFYSLLAANASVQSRVLAFEPDPAVLTLLRLNIEANGLQDRIHASAAALSSRAGRAALHVPGQDHGVIETSSSLEGTFKSWYSEVLDVETVTVDAAVAASSPPGQRVSVIKVDVAGHETAVLAGAGQTVEAHRPVLFLEVLPRADVGLLSQFIAQHNYMDVPLRSKGALSAQVAVAFAVDAWNHALVPAESLPQFLTAARSVA